MIACGFCYSTWDRNKAFRPKLNAVGWDYEGTPKVFQDKAAIVMLSMSSILPGGTPPDGSRAPKAGDHSLLSRSLSLLSIHLCVYECMQVWQYAYMYLGVSMYIVTLFVLKISSKFP